VIDFKGLLPKKLRVSDLNAQLPARRARLALDGPPATCLDLLVRSRSDVINYTELGLHQRLHRARVGATCLALMRWLSCQKRNTRNTKVTQNPTSKCKILDSKSGRIPDYLYFKAYACH